MLLHLKNVEQPRLDLIQNEIFEGVDVAVDNRHYQRCVFRDCRFVYSGLNFEFEECEVKGDLHLEFHGAARRALDFYQSLQDYILEQLPPGG